MVEDNRDAADSLKVLLTIFGYDAAVAYTGPSGVEAAKEWMPDVVLCDPGLPGLDGFGVARELRRNLATAKARMTAVNGYGSDEDRLKTREAAFDAKHPSPPTRLRYSNSWRSGRVMTSIPNQGTVLPAPLSKRMPSGDG